MFGLFVVAQFWTFCADIYADERGKRMMPLVALGATSGAATGSWIVDKLVSTGIVDTEALLLVATAPLFVSIALTRMVADREPRSTASPPANTPPGKQLARLFDGARLVLLSRFLLAAALVTLLTNRVNTNGENLLFRVVQETLTEQAETQGLTSDPEVLEYTRAGSTAFFVFNVALVIGWPAFTLMMIREHRKASRGMP